MEALRKLIAVVILALTGAACGPEQLERERPPAAAQD